MGQKSHSCFIHLAGLFSVQRGPRRVQVHGIPTTRARTNLTKRNCRSLPLQCCFGPTPAFSQQIPARAKQTLPRFPRGNLRRRGHDTVRFGIVPSFAPPPRAPPISMLEGSEGSPGVTLQIYSLRSDTISFCRPNIAAYGFLGLECAGEARGTRGEPVGEPEEREGNPGGTQEEPRRNPGGTQRRAWGSRGGTRREPRGKRAEPMVEPSVSQ